MPVFAPSSRNVIRTVAALAILLAACWGGAELWWIYHAKRFQEVRPGVLYRTGQPSEEGFRYLVRSKHIKTIVTLQSFEPKLRQGHYDPGQPSGRMESEFAHDLHVKFEHWPLGDEACWPWPAPWHFEAFFKLLDEPANHPVLLHCQGGRHRTGTLSAIYRLEYDRWPVDRVLKEMYSFKFGPPAPIQEQNLRTYYPRPRPSPDEWSALDAAFGPLLTKRAGDYEALVYGLRHLDNRAELNSRLTLYLQAHEPFGVCLAQRLIDNLDDPLVPAATAEAIRTVTAGDAPFADRAMAAALIADFGQPQQQYELLCLLWDESQGGPVSPRYRALTAGVANRYTTNRLPYLEPLLYDEREQPEPGANHSRYCDTAVAKMTAILDLDLSDGHSARFLEGGRKNAMAWFLNHRVEAQLADLLPPGGKDEVRAMRPDDEIEGRKLR